MFSSIKYVNDANFVAQVNHDDNSLLINETIWQHLNDDVKQFILWHEEGHLKLDTRDEFEANGYAIDKYVKSAEIRDPKDYSRVIVFLTNTYDMYNAPSPTTLNTNDKSNFVPIAAAIIAAAGGIGSALISKSNIGSKARKKEASYMAELQMQMEAQRQQSQKQLIMYGIIGIVVIIVLITVLMVVKNKMK